MMLNEVAKKKRLPKKRKSKDKLILKGCRYKLALGASVIALFGLVLYYLYYHYGYLGYVSFFFMSFFMFLVGLIMVTPAYVFWKDQEKKPKHSAKFHTWCLRTLQHGIVAIGSALIYITAIGIYFTSEPSVFLYLYSITAIITTYLGNKHYLRYYQINRLVYPQGREVALKLLVVCFTLFLVIWGAAISYQCIRDIPYIGNPKTITIYDVSVKYQHGSGKSVGYYRIIGKDIHGKQEEFQIGIIAVENIDGHTSSYLDITYLPNSNIVLKVE